MMTTETNNASNVWRQVGTVTITRPSRLGVGDPCYGGLSSWPDVTLTAGDWCWDVRTLGGQTSEVRLRREGVSVVDDWVWVDDYQYYVERPQPDAVRVDILGVDSGTMAWMIGDLDVELDDVRYDTANVPLQAGRLLVTGTGCGDGGYPFAVRRDATGVIVEARVMFLTDDLPPLDTTGVLTLLPGALEGVDLVGDLDGCTIRVSRRWYRIDRTDGDGGPSESTYDSVRGVIVNGIEYIAQYRDEPQVRYLPDVVGRVGALWSRTEPAAKAALTVGEDIVDVRPGVASGRIQDTTISDVLVTLRTAP